jgi:hypothetical protein
MGLCIDLRNFTLITLITLIALSLARSRFLIVLSP